VLCDVGGRSIGTANPMPMFVGAPSAEDGDGCVDPGEPTAITG